MYSLETPGNFKEVFKIVNIFLYNPFIFLQYRCNLYVYLALINEYNLLLLYYRLYLKYKNVVKDFDNRKECI